MKQNDFRCLGAMVRAVRGYEAGVTAKRRPWCAKFWECVEFQCEKEASSKAEICCL